MSLPGQPFNMIEEEDDLRIIANQSIMLCK
jgi:hypothetical protein